MRTLFGSLLLAACAIVAGCIITVPPEISQPAPTPPVRAKEPNRETAPRPVSDTDRLLSYYAYAQSLAKEQLAKELEQTRRFYETNGSGFARMQLLLVRIAANPEQRDPDKILELLQVQLSAKNDGEAELSALASLLKALLSDNRQLESGLESHKERLKEETKKTEALKQKLDALIESERKLLERSRPK